MRSAIFPTLIYYTGVGKCKILHFPYPYILHRGGENARSCYFPNFKYQQENHQIEKFVTCTHEEKKIKNIFKFRSILMQISTIPHTQTCNIFSKAVLMKKRKSKVYSNLNQFCCKLVQLPHTQTFNISLKAERTNLNINKLLFPHIDWTISISNGKSWMETKR